MVNKTDLTKLLLLSIALFTINCTKNNEWDIGAINTIASNADNKEKKKLFTKKVLPILKQKHKNLLSDYTNCSGKPINENSYLPLIKGALFRENRIEMLDSITEIDTNSLNTFVITQLKNELLKGEQADSEWITVLILLLPEDRSAIANIRGILCSVLSSNTGAPVNKKLLETIEAAF